jgi:Na+-driven multidrug efflux pump
VNTYLDALGRTDVTFITGLLAMVTNIVLNLVFIPRWGVPGAAWATVISLFFSMVVREAAFHYLIFHKKAIR